MQKRVAIIDPLGAHGSSHHLYLYGQVQGLINNDVRVSLYTNNQTRDPRIKGLNFFQFYRNIFLSQFSWISALRYLIGSIYSILHAKIYGSYIFHFHIFYNNILVIFNLVFVKLMFGRIVITVHDVESFGNKNYFSRFSYNLADSILTHNNFSRHEILKFKKSLEDKVRVIPHGSYLPFIQIEKDKLAARRIIGIPTKRKVILFFGLIKKVKGLELLLEALNIVKDKYPEVVLLIAGKIWKNNFDTYQNIIDVNNLDKHCLLRTRFIPDEDVRNYFGASDVVVLPYRKIFQSGVLMMALSYEKPVLVSDLPPFKEIIKDGNNGFIFEQGNPSDLADKLIMLFKNEKGIDHVIRNSNQLIKTKFNWTKIGEETKNAYQAII